MLMVKDLKDFPQQQPAAVAVGYFDGVHLGHQQVIRSAASFRPRLCPCVFTFSQMGEVSKGAQILSDRLKLSELERMGIAKLFAPDFQSMRGMEPEQFVLEVLLGQLQAKVLCCGEDYRFGKGAVGDVPLLRRLCEPRGVQVLAAKEVEWHGRRISSSQIREQLAAGQMPEVLEQLGRPYAIDFEVTYGRQLGRELNFPTINQPYPKSYCVPRFGVYATLSLAEGELYPSVTNVGVKPTVGSDGVLAETYLIGCHKNLYGRRVPVFFLEFIRPEQRFSSIDELQAHIRADTLKAAEIGARWLGQNLWFGEFCGVKQEGNRP